MVIYDSASIYIESASSLCDKITRIEAVLVALEATLLKAADGDNVTEYSVDDGQTKIKTVNRGVKEIVASMDALDRIKQRYINQLNGRQFRLVDGKSLRRH